LLRYCFFCTIVMWSNIPKSMLNFINSLERFTGQQISETALHKAIDLYNKNRSIVKAIYNLRKLDPPLLSGVEMTQALVAMSSIPVSESIHLLDGYYQEIKQRETGNQKYPRIMVVGAQIDNIDFIKLIEDSGAKVVVDDLCPGTRENWPEVEINEHPVDGLAERYLRRLMCSRTFREKKGDYPGYLKERFGHIGKMAADFQVDGIILLVYRYCDPFGFEVPQLKSYIESLGIPLLYVEDEYFMLSKSRIQTRIQAFLETACSLS